MPRKPWLMVVLCLILIVTSSCAGKGGSSSEARTIHLVVMPGALPHFKALGIIKLLKDWAAEFHEQHPNLTVEIRELDMREMMDENGEFAMELAFGEEAEVDAILAPAYFVRQLQAKSVIVPMGPYLEADAKMQRADFIPSLLTELEIDGALYGMPAWMNPHVIRYNKSLLAQAGIEAPATDWSWDQFVATAQALRKALPSRQFVLAMGTWDVVSAIYAHGGGIFDDLQQPQAVTLDRTENRAAIQALIELTKLALIPTPKEVAAYKPEGDENNRRMVITQKIDGEQDPEQAALWQEMMDYSMQLNMAVENGDVALWSSPLDESGIVFSAGAVSGSAKAGEQKPELGAALFPRAQQFVVPTQATALCMAASSQQRDATWQWLRFMLDQAPPLGLPSRYSLMASPQVTDGLGPERAALAKAIVAHQAEMTFLPAISPVSTEPVAGAVWQIWNGMGIDEALEAARAALDKSLKSWQASKDQG